jgi:hypothetical protein
MQFGVQYPAKHDGLMHHKLESYMYPSNSDVKVEGLASSRVAKSP